jgi:UDP-glucose 4-epimerase
VTVVDHSSADKMENLKPFFSNHNFDFIKLDLLDYKRLKEVAKKNDLIFHLAGNVDVRKGQINTEIDFLNNIVATRNVLESMRDSNACNKIIFTSSSVIYGENPTIPTSENYGPLKPISLYGASKLACEALISAYVGTFGIAAVIFRLANIVGPCTGHGVIFDFFRKLKLSNGKRLEVLGDGKQRKSYLYIDDCISALLLGLNEFGRRLEIFNVGSDDQIDTDTIAQIIITELGIHPEILHLFDTKDGRGWAGDIKDMLLSTDKLKKIGWKINHSSKETVFLTVKNIIQSDSGKNII